MREEERDRTPEEQLQIAVFWAEGLAEENRNYKAHLADRDKEIERLKAKGQKNWDDYIRLVNAYEKIRPKVEDV